MTATLSKIAVSYENRGEGINTCKASTNAVVQDSTVYNNRSFNMYVDSSCNTTVRKNLIYQTKAEYIMDGIALGAETAMPSAYISIYDNLVTGCLTNFQIDSNVTTLSHVEVVYNTFVNSVGGVSNYNMGVCFRPDISSYSGCTFENNIVMEEDSTRVPISVAAAHSGLTFSNNCWNKTPVSAARGTGDVIADPLLAKSGSTAAGELGPGWFEISANSPARDRAIVLSDVTDDFFGTPRGSAPDMGAYEVAGSPPLTSSAAGSPTGGQVPLTVNFTGSASGGASPYTYQWTFGDGGSSTSQNPSHTYYSTGNFTATLTVTDSLSATSSSTVPINVALPVSANIVASPTSGQAPLAVSFSGSATGGVPPYSYVWAFGIGASSKSQNSSYTYSTGGSYVATLTVADSQTTTSCKSVTIAVSATTQALVATASASPTSGQAPLAVIFSGGATGGASPYSYSWTFGDGGSSKSRNPSHTYSSAGSYVATLNVTDNQHTTNGKSLAITVTASAPALAATASALPTSGQAPLAVIFFGSATGGAPPYSYRWTFGDGGSSTSENPSYTYSAPGSYTATLLVTDDNQTQASSSVSITTGSLTMATGLALAAQTGAPAPGLGGTTSPSPGDYSYSVGSSVRVNSVPNTDYRFSRWSGDITDPLIFNASANLTLDTNKSLSAIFCTKCGDVNGDLKITPADAQMAFDIFLGRIADPTWCELENAAVKGDGTKLAPKVTPADAKAIFSEYLRGGIAAGDCSGNSRTEALEAKSAGLANAVLTISNVSYTSSRDILVPVVVECPSGLGSFGFDLAFPSKDLTFVRVESAQLTEGFDQLDANVVPYPSDAQDQVSAAASKMKILRVGGYKVDAAQTPSSSVLVTLVFRTKGGFFDASSLSLIKAYDDLKSASLVNSATRGRDNVPGRENKDRDKSVKPDSSDSLR